MLSAKLKMLKELQRQMHCDMADGYGDDEDKGKDALAQLKDDDDEGSLAAKVDDAEEDALDGDDDDMKSLVRGFFKRPAKLPMKDGAVIMVASGNKPSMGKMGRKHG